MSHFVVVLAMAPTLLSAHEGNVETAAASMLAPFHEFECTGVDDEFVQNVDVTAQDREDYEKQTTVMIKLPDGTLTSPFTDEGNYKPEFLQEKEDGIFAGSKQRTLFVPEGCERVDVPTPSVQSFSKFISDWRSAKIVFSEDEIDLAGEHKYGYALARRRDRALQLEDGVIDDVEIIKVINRTNAQKYVWLDGSNRRLAVTLDGNEVLPFVRPDPSGEGFLLDDEAGLVSLLQDLYTPAEQGSTHNRPASEMVSPSNLRVITGAVSGDAVGAGWEVRDLPASTVWPSLGCRSLSCEREGSRVIVYELQHGARQVPGRSGPFDFSGGISGPITRHPVGGKKWDWWQIGGRWSGYFLEEGSQGNPNVPAILQGLTSAGNVIAVGDWPFEERLAEAIKVNERYYDDIHAAIAGLPDYVEFQTFLDTMPRMPPLTREEALEAIEVRRAEWPALPPTDDALIQRFIDQSDPMREIRKAYHAQPIILASKGVMRFDKPDEPILSGWGDSVSDWIGDRDAVVFEHAAGGIAPYAMLDEGGWASKGEMGWFGVSLGDDAGWRKAAIERLRSYSADTLLVACDCHI